MANADRAASSGSFEEIEEQRRYAAAILHTMRQPLVVLNSDLELETANRAFYAMFKVDAGETDGRKIYELGNGQWNIPELRRLLEDILPNSGEVVDYTVEHTFEEIGRRVMMVNAHRMERGGGNDRILISIDDVTEREDQRWLLEAEKEYAEKIVDASRDALLILGWDLRVKTANETFYETFKVDQSQTEGRLVYELGNGQWNIPRLRYLLESVLPDNDTFDDFEVEHEFDGIGRRIMVLNARRVDHTQLILLAIEDQTEARRARASLKESEERYRTLFEAIDEGFCIIEMVFDERNDPTDYRFLEINPAFVRQTGLKDAVGRRMRELEPKHEEFWYEIYGRIALTGEPARFEHGARHLGNRWYDVYAFRIGDPQQRRVAIIFRDVADRKAAEAALQESQQRLAAVMEHAPLGIGLIDREGRWVLSNPALQRLTCERLPSSDPEQAARWRPADSDGPATPRDWPGARALRGEVVSSGVDFRVDVKGEEVIVRVSAAPIRDEGGDTVEYAVCLAEDVTKQKRTEAQRELLLGELNHRVKNVFAVIRSLASQGNGERSAGEFRRVFLGRLDALVGAHTLALESNWESVNLDELALRTLRPYTQEHPERVEIEGPSLELPPRPALSLSLVLHELATNAVKYGALSTTQGRVRLAWRAAVEDGNKVHLSWHETGGPPVSTPERPGFGTRLVERVFEYELGGECALEFRADGLRVEAWFRPG